MKTIESEAVYTTDGRSAVGACKEVKKQFDAGPPIASNSRSRSWKRWRLSTVPWRSGSRHSARSGRSRTHCRCRSRVRRCQAGPARRRRLRPLRPAWRGSDNAFADRRHRVDGRRHRCARVGARVLRSRRAASCGESTRGRDPGAFCHQQRRTDSRQCGLRKESQEASGIAVQTLEKARAEAATEVYGVIVNVQPLIDLRARYSTSRVRRAFAARCGVEQRSRLPAFQEAVRRRSQRFRARIAGGGSAVESGPGQARGRRAGGGVGARHRFVRAGARYWPAGPPIWSRRRSRAWRSSARLLAQITLPQDLHAQAGKMPMSLAPISVPGEARPARFISTAPQTDATLPGVTYFYVVGAQGLRVGMRVAGAAQTGRQDARWRTGSLGRGGVARREGMGLCEGGGRPVRAQGGFHFTGAGRTAGSTRVTLKPATRLS